MVGLEGLRTPRNAGIACACAATALGLFYLAVAGAPMHYLVVNATALLLGIVAFGGVAAARPRPGRALAVALLLSGSALLATALLGASVGGASRWILVGPLSVQVSLVLLPAMAIAFARRPDAPGTAAIALAAAALALQPDRAMAGVLAFAMAALAAVRPGRFPAAAALAALAAFAVALARPDSLPAVPFVDRILFTAFEIGPPAGAAVLLGALLLPLPAIVGWRAEAGRRPAHLVFAAVWLGCVLAAALGNYPTPLVGYGGSAILGYFLALSLLAAPAPAARGLAAASGEDEGEGLGRLRSALPA